MSVIARAMDALPPSVLLAAAVPSDQTDPHKEATLAAARFWLTAISESSDDAIIGENLAGLVTFWNRAATRMFGFGADEILGRPVIRVIPPDRLDEEAVVLAQVGRGDKTLHFETRRACKDGRVIPVSLTVSPIRDDEARLIGVSTIARDLSERDERERQLRAANSELARSNASLAHYAEALERSNAELDDFAYIASHDLKEPLRGVANNARFLREDYAGKLDPEGVERLMRLGFLCHRMEQLINDLLYFSRIGRQDLGIEWTDLNAVIRDIEMMSEAMLKERRASIVIPHELPRVTCDRIRITEVFRNLIVNAVKYNESATKLVEIGCRDEVRTRWGVERQVFYVKDNGIGIAEEFHEDIFRIFKRLNAEDDDKRGTGVGLTVVRKIVERHGGRIWVESEIGAGSTFHFTIRKGAAYAA